MTSERARMSEPPESWCYLSPHLDDAVYSCGGLIRAQTDAGQKVEIWTVCAGDPPAGPLSPHAESLHARWRTGADTTTIRRAEDGRAAACLGAGFRHLPLPDALYRRGRSNGTPLYPAKEALFAAALDPSEEAAIVWLAELLVREVPAATGLVCPLGLGGHVDHRLVRLAVERATPVHRRLRFYADCPYAMRPETRGALDPPAGFAPSIVPISERGIRAWIAAIVSYGSQWHVSWADETAIEVELRRYLRPGGLRLWCPASP
ncbi:MAG: PIG-L family deacetylase [Deltaproteobacteria bacterium]|nr:PIG-L family deacetylase [Deltaproteobacteria bacterium]